MAFSYNVPEFNDFSNNSSLEDHAKIEAYFDLEHAEHDLLNGFAIEEIVCNSTFEERDNLEVINAKDPLGTCIRRSSSVNDLYTRTVYSEPKESESHCTSKLQNKLMPKTLSRSKSTQSLVTQNKKFVSVAEAVKTFHLKTPDRFHTRSHMSKPDIKSAFAIPQCTIPNSPFLATKHRARATTVLSQAERELMEVEEMLKYKIKANPLNPKILAGPLKLKPSRKPSTVPQPFKITEVPVRAPVTPVHVVPQFYAHPVPKYLKDRAVTPIIKAPVIKQIETKKKLEFKVNCKLSEEKPLSLTKPAPFSFEERDKDLFKKKDEALRRLLEQEKKNREFHAKPLPKYIATAEGGNATVYSKSCTNLKYASTDNLTPVFKAKPAKVLHMKPFEPKKGDRPLVEIAEFQLNTTCRAKQRVEFQQKLKEKETLLERLRLLREEEQLRKEEEEIKKLRKEAEHKAQPIRRYKDVEAVASKDLTVPISPNFRQNKSNKENILP